MNSLGEGSQLFRTIIDGELTDDQWETFKELKNITKDLVENADCSELESEGDSDELNCDSEAFLRLQRNRQRKGTTSPVLIDGENEISDGDETEDVIEEKRKGELAAKYMNGELTFSEFTALVDPDAENVELKESTEAFSEKDQESVQDDIKLQRELDEELERTKRTKRSKKGLPRYLQGLMGEANLCFARGDHKDAITMCMEIIRLDPAVAEPFQTLGMIYEEIGDTEKSFQFSLIAAYLSPNDPEEWIKLAELSVEKGDFQQAITCYTKAIRCEPKNVELLWARCDVYQQIGDTKRLLYGLYEILKNLKPEEGNSCLQLAREIAKIHYDSSQIDQAIIVMKTAFRNHPTKVAIQDTNLLLELLMSKKDYLESVEVIVTHCNVRFEGVVLKSNGDALTPTDLQNSTRCTIPKTFPIDLQVKLAVCLIHLQCFHLVEELFANLKRKSPEDIGDLYLDLAEACMEAGKHSEALPLLSSLVASKHYNLAAVWLRYGECFNALGNIEKAAPAYEEVVRLAPFYPGARMVLSGLQQQLGKPEEALAILLQESEEKGEGELDIQLVWQRCNLLYARSLWDEFIRSSFILFQSQFIWLSKPHHMTVVSGVRSHRRRTEVIRDLQAKDKIPQTQRFEYINMVLTAEQLWDTFIKVCSKLYELKRYAELEMFTISSLTSVIFSKYQKEEECEWLSLLASCYNHKPARAYNLIREFISKDKNNNKIWNMFAQIVSMGEDLRHNRFCLRLMAKHQDHFALSLLNGHNAFVAGSYKHALGEYMSLFKLNVNDPFLAFSIANIYIHMACQKFSGKKHVLVVQAAAFLDRYKELRGECQETYYNLGRAMHQLGILHLATYYYKKALSFDSAIVDQPTFDLTREIAYNLCNIYIRNNSFDLARMYMDKYCVIE